MARLDPYDIGDLWVAQSTFTVGGVNTDPTTITVKQQTPSGAETTLASAVATSGLNASSTPVAKTATGIYKLNPGITLNEAGRWYVRFEGAGAVTASEEHEAVVVPSVFTSESGVDSRALVTLRETKDWLKGQGVEAANTVDDLELVRVINDISDRFHQEAEREFKVSGTNPQTRTFIAEPIGRRQPWYIDGDYQGDYNVQRRRITVGDLTSYTQVQIIDNDWTTVLETVNLADITALPTVRQASQPIRELEFQSDVTSLSSGMRVAVLGTWGFPSVPGDVRQAVLDAIAAVMDRDVEHYRQDLGFGGSSNEGGTTIMIGRSNQRFVSLPPTSLAVAWRYRQVAVSVG
jgi:hypothetical protein